MSNTKIVKEALAKGALVYLLDLFCNATNPQIREKTAELFAKMLSDKLVGPKVRLILMKFLPAIFMDAMRDSPDASVHMFEGELKTSTKWCFGRSNIFVCFLFSKKEQSSNNNFVNWHINIEFEIT